MGFGLQRLAAWPRIVCLWAAGIERVPAAQLWWSGLDWVVHVQEAELHLQWVSRNGGTFEAQQAGMRRSGTGALPWGRGQGLWLVGS